MQSLSVPAARNPSGRSPEEILAALRGVSGSRRISFRYELLDQYGDYVRDMPEIRSCKITQNWLADIKRTATFVFREAGGIDYLSDRIKPYIRLWLAPYGPLDWVEWPQGVFILSGSDRGDTDERVITREIEAYDMLKIFMDDAVETRYTVAASTVYLTAVRSLLGIGNPGRRPWPGTVLFPPSTASTPTALEWDPGTPKLKIINDLLGAINYESLSFNEDGNPVIRAYVPPEQRPVEYTYATDTESVIVPTAKQTLDLWSVPNKWILVVSEPDREPLVASYTNDDPSSPTSTIRRGRTIVDFRTEENAVDLPTLQAKAARLAQEASQVFESVEFSTAMMPIHSGNDVYQIQYDRLSINGKYTEHTWEMELRAGARMTHRARRVVVTS